MLEKLPCPDNLKLIPWIRQQLSLDHQSTFFRGVFGELAIHDNKTAQVFFGAPVEKGGSRQLITC